METTPQANQLPDLPADCSHKEWIMGCERCFYEMRGIVDGTVRMDMRHAQVEGAILLNWHMLMIVNDIEAQLMAQTQSIDLQRVAFARGMASQMRNLSVYMIQLVSDPRRLAEALSNAAIIAAETRARIAQEAEAGSRPIVVEG